MCADNDHTKKIHYAISVLDRIVTYKLAAAILAVDVNEAKTILKQYVNLKSDKDVNISYVVGGITKDKKHKICIVRDDKYNEAKIKFSQLTIDHIYSIQKSRLDWASVFNVNDFLRDNNEPKEAKSKREKHDAPEVKNEESSVKFGKTLPPKKKESISSFFSQVQRNTATTKAPVTKEPIKTEKSVKSNALTSFMSKSNNKENTSKSINAKMKKEIPKSEVIVHDSDDNEEIFVKTSKKRIRVLNDDDDDEDNVTTKCPKVDILDDPTETEGNASDEDLFGSPERQESEEMIISVIPTDIIEIESSTPSNTTEEMYEDDEGYFVTEKKPGPKKPTASKQSAKVETKKESVAKQKEEKETKKEINKKLKKNTNQNTLFSYFQKK